MNRKCHHRQHPQRGRAFTLLELLTVVAVLSILAGLLLPAINRSRLQARRVQCLSNLRQVGLAVQLYWDDQGGRAFRYRRDVSPQGARYWFGWLDHGTEGDRRFDATQGVLHPYLGSNSVEICPGLEYRRHDFKRKAITATYGYGYNLQLSAMLQRPPVLVSAIFDPAGTVVFADAAQINTFQPPASPDNPMLEEFYYVNTNEPTVHFRHGQRANLLFVDGHVAHGSPIPGSIDARLPRHQVGELPGNLLRLQP